MAGRLVALDLPGGPDFIEELQRIWANGDAAFPVDQRFPELAKQQACAAMRVGADVEPGDALVVATSGSTGSPKGVILTHDAVAASAEATSMRLGVDAGDHWLACLPLSHVGGLSVVTRALHTGTALTALPVFDAAAVDASDANLISLVATALTRIDTTKFRTIVLGGARPPAGCPTNAVTTYGLTETGSGVVYDGIPLNGVEVKIDGDHEIALRGPMLTRGYRNGQSPVTGDGWLLTGDLGHWTAGGQLHVEGRKGDLIICGGENIWPEAVELLVATHPDVADVMARGVDDAEWGQVVEVVVVPVFGRTPDLESVRSHVKQTAPSYLAPKRLTLVESLPRTALGKLRRTV